MAQLATAIKKYKDSDTFLVDVGDLIQGNSAELFMEKKRHPLVKALNSMKYDFEVVGNHEFDYTPEALEKFIQSFKGTVLTGNLYYKDGKKACDGYKIVKKNGVRVAFIGMTTPNTPTTFLQDTPGMELVNKVMMKYADCDVSCMSNFDPNSNIEAGDIHKCDVSRLYKYSNNLWKVRMTGRQLKIFLEDNAKIYETYKQGDKGVKVKPDLKICDYYMFEGIKYDIDVSQEEGNRIKNLTRLDDHVRV